MQMRVTNKISIFTNHLLHSYGSFSSPHISWNEVSFSQKGSTLIRQTWKVFKRGNPTFDANERLYEE
jgi:hypothetical protein